MVRDKNEIQKKEVPLLRLCGNLSGDLALHVWDDDAIPAEFL